MAKKKDATAAKMDAELNHLRKIKTYKGEWYTVNSILGNEWARYFILLGGREAGKSYSVMNWAVRQKLKKKDKVKFYWLRLTDAAAKNLTADGGAKFVDPDLQTKYNLHTFSKNGIIYTYTPRERVIHHRDGSESIKEEKDDIKEFCTILSCSTFYNTKGVGYFDNTYDGEYIIVLDEMNREQSERNTFDITYNFVNLLENLVRSTKTRIKIFMIGNTLDEASDILTAFNFLPDGFGRYKLKSKHAVIDYIKPSEKYKERRKDTIADNLAGSASTFTNEVEIDRSLLVNKRRKHKPHYVIKFSKGRDSWFTVWNDNIMTQYGGEQVSVVPMRRYIDARYQQALVDSVIEQFDARAYRFTNLSCFKLFEKQLKLLKPQK